MTQVPTFQAVSLDVDGVLYDLDHFKVNLALRRPLELRAWMAMERARTQVRRQRLEGPDLEAQVQRLMAQELGWPLGRVQAQVQKMIQRDWPALLRKVGPYRKLHLLLDALEAAQIPMLLCSDYPVEEKAQALGLASRPWRAMLDAASHGGLKPRPEVFQAAARALGCAPEAILHIGDSPELDVQGAAPLGMQTALVGRKWKDGSVQPTWRVRHMNVLCEQVAQALGTR